MGESVKSVCMLVVIVTAIASVFAWMQDRPETLAWSLRIGLPVLGLLALGLILKLQFRKDLVPDFLHEMGATYFNREGLCFAFAANAIDGTAYLEVYFQNQYETPCVAQIALRPARGFLMGRENIDAIGFEVKCLPGGFGVSRIAIPVPAKLQGKVQSFEVGANVLYPNGKGARLRFGDGIFLRANSSFGNGFGTALIIAGAAGGQIVMAKPAIAKIHLPNNVREHISKMHSETETLWKLGDPLLAGS